MKVPFYWLLEYVVIDLTAEELARRLTMTGIEVDSVEQWAPSLPGVVVARIISLSPHPQADRLQLAEVDAGSYGVKTIVCGAPNIKAGDLVPLALPGAELPGGKIRPTTIRGVKSEGMLCSASELGLEIVQPREGLLILEGEHQPGTTLQEAYRLDEPVLDLDLTPNRSDCQGMLGVAREVAAITGGRLNLPQVVVEETGPAAADSLQVHIPDPDLCLRYAARVMENVQVAPSPHAFQLRLLAAGIRPINNVVDVTNYVMWEYGQPMHAFDRRLLSGSGIYARRAHKGEKITTLDQVIRDLEADMLVIADQEKPVAVAGVMGGEATEISDSTENLLLESALFSHVSVRRTSRALGLRTEASIRFERGVDPEGVIKALDRCAALIKKIAGGKVHQGIVDNYPQPRVPKVITFRPEKADQLLGVEVPREQMLELFNRLGMAVEQDGQNFQVHVPSLRMDITMEVDLIEEIGRLYGYGNIPATLPVGEMTSGQLSRRQSLDLLARRHLAGLGLSEIVAFSFTSPQDLAKMNYPREDPRRQAIPILKPMSEDQSLLRTGLLPGMLRTAAYNFNHRVQDQMFFELGKVYNPHRLPLKELPREPWHLGILITGRIRDDWMGKEEAGFYYLKGIFASLAQAMLLPEAVFMAEAGPEYHPTRSAQLLVRGTPLGYLGQVHPEVTAAWEIDFPVYAAELDFDAMAAAAKRVPEYVPVPRYPAALRDIAVVVRESIPAAKLEAVIRRAGGDLIASIKLFDLYQGKQIPSGHKSMAYSVTLRHPDRTLTDQEAEQAMEDIRRALTEEFSATFRS